MRVSSSMLAAGLAACALAAPGVQRRNCKSKSPSSSAASSAQAIPASSSSSAEAAPTVTSSSSSSTPVVAATSSATAVETTSSAAAAAAAATTTSASGSATSSASAAGSSASSSSSASSGSLQFLGASESGAEFGTGTIPGAYGTDFIFPNTSAIQTLIDDVGMNMFRIPFLMERLAQSEMTATLDADYLANLTTVVKYITDAGKYAVLDPHNYARYNSEIISSTSDFQTFWTNVATEFADNSNVVFDCNNEPHDMTTDTQTAELMQACVTGIRAAGATTQYIFVEGTSYTGAWTWTTSGNSENMGNITDTVDNLLVYEMHQYLDSDGSGTSETCVSTTIGAERIEDATTWLRENKKIGIIGEFAGGSNSDCETAVTGMLDYMTENSDVWIGAMWWGAGPWWADYIYSMEPPSGTGYEAYKSILAKYAPSA